MFASISRTSRKAFNGIRASSKVSLDGYGQHLFKGAVAAPYLEKVGLPKNTLDGHAWTTDGNADKVAFI